MLFYDSFGFFINIFVIEVDISSSGLWNTDGLSFDSKAETFLSLALVLLISAFEFLM